ncbi:hypothetical protein MAR_014695, partial [Mya arenaria]
MAECSENLNKTEDDSDSVGGKVSGNVCENTLICEPCQEDGVENPAVKWCTDCEDHLCKTCVEHHQKAKPSRNHVLVTSDEIPKGKVCIGVENIEEMVQNVDEWGELMAFTDKLKKVLSKYEEKKKTAIATAEYINESAEDAMLKLNIMKSKDVKNNQKIEQTCETVLLEIRSIQEALLNAHKAQDKIKVFTLLKSFANGVDFMDKNSANVDPTLQFGQYRVTKQPTNPLMIRQMNIGSKETVTGLCLLGCNTLAISQNDDVKVITISNADSKPQLVYSSTCRGGIVIKASGHGKL